MRAIILAGGKGTRLRGVVDDVPKPMAPIGGRPFLEYLIGQLKSWGIRDIVLSVGYKGEIIKARLGDGTSFGVRIAYSEEKEPLGTGGALKQALLLNDDPRFLVMNGDSYFAIPFPDLVACHASRSAVMTMSLASVTDKGRYGHVEVDRDGLVLNFQKEGAAGPGLINGGIYLIERDLVRYIPDGTVSLEGDVLPLVQRERRLYGRGFDAFFVDIGLPEDYRRMDRHPEYFSIPPGKNLSRGDRW